jgi:hypothetical protein
MTTVGAQAPTGPCPHVVIAMGFLRICWSVLLAAVLHASVATVAPATARELTIRERVEAQRAIERIYYAGDRTFELRIRR